MVNESNNTLKSNCFAEKSIYCVEVICGEYQESNISRSDDCEPSERLTTSVGLGPAY